MFATQPFVDNAADRLLTEMAVLRAKAGLRRVGADTYVLLPLCQKSLWPPAGLWGGAGQGPALTQAQAAEGRLPRLGQGAATVGSGLSLAGLGVSALLEKPSASVSRGPGCHPPARSGWPSSRLPRPTHKVQRHRTPDVRTQRRPQYCAVRVGPADRSLPTVTRAQGCRAVPQPSSFLDHETGSE